MKFNSGVININPKLPIKQIGFIHQTEKIFKFHDNLHARFLILEEDFIYIHISIDALGIDLSFTTELEKITKKRFAKETHITISATHTHFGADTYDEKYRAQLMHQLVEAINSIELVSYPELKVSYISIDYNEVGKSRITDHEAIPILGLLEIYHDKKVIANIINYNCHPTILSGKNTDFFSSEFPGYVINKLNDYYKHEFFTYISGAMGDISTRFTRKSQDYNCVKFLGDKLFNKIVSLKNKNKKTYSLTLDYKEKIIIPKHEFKEIAINRNNLNERELETIEYGKRYREALKEKNRLMDTIKLSTVSFGKYNIIFSPNELFSSYIKLTDHNKTVIACYSNGYGPYMLDINAKIFTYEAFTDTFSDETKLEICNQIREWSNINKQSNTIL